MPEDCSVCCQQAKEKRRSLNAIFQPEANSAILTLLTVIWPALSSKLRHESQQCSLFGCRTCFQLLQTASNCLRELKESVDQVEDVLQQSGRFEQGLIRNVIFRTEANPGQELSGIVIMLHM